MAILRRILGTVLFLLGIVAVPLPILPGAIFMAIGLYVLSIDSPGLAMRLAALRTRAPAIDHVVAFFERLSGRSEPPSKDATIELPSKDPF